MVLTGFYLGFKLQFKFKLQWERVCFKLNIYKQIQEKLDQYLILLI